jgi:DNA-binding PadR family transcriptional regulator
MRTLDLRFTVLRMLMGSELYGYEIHKRLSAEGIEVGVSRLYKALHEMQINGLLESHWENSKMGPKKRLYKIGKKGKQDLDEVILSAISTVHSAYVEYLMALSPESNIFCTMAKLATDELEDHSNVAYVASDSSPMNDKTIEAILQIAPKSKTYIIKPNTVNLKRQFENTTVLEGWYDNLPLKDNYLDLLFLTGMPKKKNFERDLQEWSRVLKENGRLAILIPTILFNAPSDPLTLGDFIERWEHETFQKSEVSDLKQIKITLQNYCFPRVEEKQFVHMTLILASKSTFLSCKNRNL